MYPPFYGVSIHPSGGWVCNNKKKVEKSDFFWQKDIRHIWWDMCARYTIYCINSVKIKKKRENSAKKQLFTAKKVKFVDTVYGGCYTALKLEVK